MQPCLQPPRGFRPAAPVHDVVDIDVKDFDSSDITEQILVQLRLLPDLRFVPRVRVFVRDFGPVNQQASEIGCQAYGEGEGRHVRSGGPAVPEAALASLRQDCGVFYMPCKAHIGVGSHEKIAANT